MIYIEFLLVTLATIAYTVAGIVITRRSIRHHVRVSHNEVLVPIFITGGTIYAVFLAFLVVTVWASHDNAKADVADEASGLATMYRAAIAMEPVSGGALRQLIRTYTNQVIVNEWPIQAANGGFSDQARQTTNRMFALFGALDQTGRRNDFLVDQTELQLLTQTMATRNTRLLESNETLSSLMWITGITSGALVIAMTFFLFMETAWLQIVMASFLAMMICMMLFITFILSRPFVGPLAVSSRAFQQSLILYNQIDNQKDLYNFSRSSTASPPSG